MRNLVLGAVLLGGISLVACSSDDVTTSSAATSSGGAGSAAGGSTATNTASGGTAAGGWGQGGIGTEVSCRGKVYECGDGIDNDGDGKIDWQDEHCLGPCDNNEDGFDLGIPGGDNNPCKLDCYYDTNSGASDCQWDRRCDPLSTAPPADPVCVYQDPPPQSAKCPDFQPQSCHDFCPDITPNGCDCFGCCELPAESGSFVWIGSYDANGDPSCTMDGIADPTKCNPCTQVPDCTNDCGRCELCLGKTTLPPDCFPGSGGAGAGGNGAGGGGDEQCPPGIQACGLPNQPDCPGGSYCLTGCCRAVLN